MTKSPTEIEKLLPSLFNTMGGKDNKLWRKITFGMIKML
jgi:hypothetical protein